MKFRDGQSEFSGYLISRFYATREIRENQMQAKNQCFTVLLSFPYPKSLGKSQEGCDYSISGHSN